MKVLLVGGGTGGHVTPLLAVAHELKKRHSDIQIDAVTDNGNKFSHLLEDSPDIDSVVKISAGKLRRYPNRTLAEKLVDIKTIALNARDSARVAKGIAQASKFLTQSQPDIIFIKGGFVGVPVGIAAQRKHIPFITHDSDTIPGLANRIIGRWANVHAVGMPERFYSYPEGRTVHVGIPTPNTYKSVSQTLKKALRAELKLSDKAKVIVITGGSQGAQRINKIISQAYDQFINEIPDVVLIHQTGARDDTLPDESATYRHFDFTQELYKYTGAADIVIARAGASTMAELAVQGTPSVIIPSPYLAGGHQLENARHLADNKAAIVCDEKELTEDPAKLVSLVKNLLDDAQKQKELSENLRKLYKVDAAAQIADLILETSKNSGSNGGDL